MPTISIVEKFRDEFEAHLNAIHAHHLWRRLIAARV